MAEKSKEELLNWYRGEMLADRYSHNAAEARAAVLARMCGPGEVVVPKEPTEEMEEAGWIDKEDVCPCDIYRAMLAARPNNGGTDDAAA